MERRTGAKTRTELLVEQIVWNAAAGTLELIEETIGSREDR